MAPPSENPLVKETTDNTLYELVNTMIFLVDSMPTLVEEKQDDDSLLVITPQKFSGFKNNLDVLRAATETVFTQYSKEKSAQDSLVAELEQKLTKMQALDDNKAKTAVGSGTKPNQKH